MAHATGFCLDWLCPSSPVSLPLDDFWCDINIHTSSPFDSENLHENPSASEEEHSALRFAGFSGLPIGSSRFEMMISDSCQAHEDESVTNSPIDQFASSKKRVHSHAIARERRAVDKKAKICSPQSVLEEAAEDDAGSVEKPVGAERLRGAQNCNIQAANIRRPQLCSHESIRSARKAAPSQSSASKESRWAEQLLGACATAIASNNCLRTQHLMWVLNDLASFSGDANQRLAAYGLESLFSTVTGRMVSLPPARLALPVDPDCGAPLPVHHALLRFQDVSPWHSIVYTIANGALLEACERYETVHIVDIGVSQGTQWPTFIEALATRPSGAPKLMRLTMVQDPQGSLGFIQRSPEFVARLEPFAKKLGLTLEVRTISTRLQSLTRDDLLQVEGEALLICAQFRLHRLSDQIPTISEAKSNAVIACSPRDSFLRFIQALRPNALVLSENDVDHASTDFLTRFQKAVEFHGRFLDSTNASFRGKNSEERHIVEAEAALAFINNVAFEGASRTERNETHRAWSSRISRAGFFTHFPSAEVLEHAKSILRKHDCNWDLLVEDECMVLRWKGQPATFCSVWRPSPLSNSQTRRWG